MGHICWNQEPFTSFRLDDIHEESENDADVFSAILSDKSKAKVLMVRPLIVRDGLDVSFELIDYRL